MLRISLPLIWLIGAAGSEPETRSSEARWPEGFGQEKSGDRPIAVPSAAAATYYVAPPGNDANPGTRAEPWKTVSSVNRLKPGDTLYLLPGTYEGQISSTVSGLPEKPITLASADEKAHSVIDGQGSGQTAADGKKQDGFYLNGASWITVQNLTLKNCFPNPFVLRDSSYVTLRGCRIYAGTNAVSWEGKSHHVLIEGCRWEGDPRLWTEWTWGYMHHPNEKPEFHPQYYGAGHSILIGFGLGSAVIRNNHIRYAFDAQRVLVKEIRQNANVEYYGNRIEFCRDNLFDFEGGVFNWHIYHNVLYQAGILMFSYDNGRIPDDGDIYFYGNVGHWSAEKDQPTGGGYSLGQRAIYKFVSWLPHKQELWLDKPLHAYHNSWHAGQITDPRRYQKRVRHLNNACLLDREFGFRPREYARLWDAKRDELVFDYDVSYPGKFDSWLTENGLESHGIQQDPLFAEGSKGDFRLKRESPCIDAGTVIPGFTQRYLGKAPDIGAWEFDPATGSSRLVEGPPFQVKVPPGGDLGYEEKPRITRHRVSAGKLSLSFSWPLDPASVSREAVRLKNRGRTLGVRDVALTSPTEIVITTDEPTLKAEDVAVRFDPLPRGTNGQTATSWASPLSDWTEP